MESVKAVRCVTDVCSDCAPMVTTSLPESIEYAMLAVCCDWQEEDSASR